MGGLLMMLFWIVLGLVVFVIPTWLDDKRQEELYQLQKELEKVRKNEKKEALL